MAARKPKSKKPVHKRKVYKEKQILMPALQKCDVPNICNYLQSLSNYLQLLTADYKKTKIAVCNLDHQVFGSGGNLTQRLCTGGTSGEPADPPPPPIW